uniref:HEAT repeat-containing protein 1 n=1 Tax=Lygus hesperus TaxID=30085 RepID=A0A0A9XDV9_LYGHE
MLVPCLSKISIHLGKTNPMMWDLLVHHTLLKTHSQYSKVRYTALSAIHQYFLLNREDFLLFLPRIVPRVAELLQDSSSSVETLTKEVIKVIEKLSGEPISQYLH